MNDDTFLEQFASQYKWQVAPAKRRFRFCKEVNKGMRESHRLALTMRGVLDRALDDVEGLQASDYSTYQIFEEGDLAFKLIDLENIKTSRVGLVPRRGIMSPAYIRLTPAHRSVDTRFYAWFFFAAYFNNIFNGMGGGVRQNLTPTDLLEFPIPLPDLPTQRAIADFLDRETARIDLLIEKKQRLVALLGEKARSVINQATTIGFREYVTQDSGEKWLGEVASHWRVTPLKWFTRLQSGYAFKAERFGSIGTRLVRMNNLKRGALDLEEAVCIADEDVNMSVMLCAGDILLGMSGSIGETGSLGNFAVVTEEDLPCLLNQRVGRFQFVGDELLPDYLKLVIQSASFLDPIFLAATSTAQFNISPSQVGAIMFALPPITEQKEIIQEVATRNVGFTQARERTLLSIDRLKEYRSALITAAVTGQIEVSTYAKSGATDRHLDAIQEEMGA